MKLSPLIQSLCLTTAFAVSPMLGAGAQSQDGVEFFEQKIRPILVDHCYKCHSSEAKKAKGGLQLDTQDGLLKGGDTGPAILPGVPEKSLLIKAISYADENLQMPPTKGGGGKLTQQQIDNLTQWVKIGAPDPRVSKDASAHQPETIAAKAKSHWAFQPIRNLGMPNVKNKRWVQSPVDAFILAGLESRDLSPSPVADRRTLIRRATFDLIGLPPTPAEVAAFIADKSPNAFAMVVDRLLASPRYGERWGRHWLDIARYADTKGYVFEEERRYPYSYTYRDYVIRSFNEDLPFNQFILQQVAADLMPLGDDKRPLAALGYLTLGRRFVNNIHDIIDDRIDVVCRGMMGLTVACARCHDHKYDPIPTRDYYSLYGVFASSMEPDEEPLLGMKDESKAHDEYVAEHKKRVQEKADFRQAKETETARKLRHQAGEYLLAVYDSAQLTNKAEIDTLAPNRQLDRGVLQRWISWIEANSKTNHPILGPYATFTSFSEQQFEQKSAEYLKQLPHETTINPVITQALMGHPPSNIKEVTECYGTVLKEVDGRWEALLAKPAEKSGATNAPSALPDAKEEALRQVLYAADAPANLPKSEFDRLYDVPTSQKLRELQRKIEQLDATHPGAPARAMALVDRPSPQNVHVFVRGSADNSGPEAPRQFLEILQPNRKPFEKGSGRLELAQAIVDPKNPLTARVLVNRLWQHHFGFGLVRTASDFGMRSESPSNPELLDFLATRFMQEGWSIKKMHRLIMLSSTYQQSSDENPRGEKLDPNNLLVWRMNRQRLEFEALRDSLLAVAGTLDLTSGGQSVDITTEPYSSRRTVYGYIDRQNLPGLFRTFDLASPDGTSAQRFFTTVPQQALFLMNSPFVVQQAANLVKREVEIPADSQGQRVRFLYQQVFQREPSNQELGFARDFLKSQQHPSTQESSVWQFGYGELDEHSGKLKQFKHLPYFTGTEFQGGATLPDPALGWVMLTETGGHAGNDLAHAAVRRWAAPQSGEVSITGSLSHGSAQGDGVRGRIIWSRVGELGHWLVHNDKADTKLEHIKVEKGDTIDFATDCIGNVDFDSFTWAVVISGGAGSKEEKASVWDSHKDFAAAARSSREPLSAWQKYAQVLLLANEFVFVD